MTEIQQIRKRLEDIAREVIKPYSDVDILQKELGDITQQIYKAVDRSSKENKEELYNLIMLKNIVRAKIELQKKF